MLPSKFRISRDSSLFSVLRSTYYFIRASSASIRGYFFRCTQIAIYLRQCKIRKLHIGAEHAILSGWLNADLTPRSKSVVFLDARRRMPFADRTFDYVFSEHMIEHISIRNAQKMLTECFRIMKPGARIRIATPSLEKLCGLLSSNRSCVEQEYLEWVSNAFMPQLNFATPAVVLHCMTHYWGHRFVYDEDTLTRLLIQAGFREITSYSPGESDEPQLCGVELHGSIFPNPAFNLVETMVLEAVKPATCTW